MEYLLSIIVPTKNRYQYIYSIIELIEKKYMDKSVELIIQDNSDNNTDFARYINTITNPAIKYYYEPKSLSVTENFDCGILHSSGEYITMIGDDDIVSSRLTNVASWMKENQVESAVFNKAYYKWPDALESIKNKLWKVPVNSLLIRQASGTIMDIDARQELIKVIRLGGTNLGRLPEVYHGIVARVALNRIYDQNGTFFPGPSPDMAIASALSLTVKRHVYIDAPFTCSGQSFPSTGGQGLRKQHKGKLEDMKFLPSNTLSTWESSIPKVWTPQTIYADSLFNAVKACGEERMLSEFNYEQCYSNLISQYPEFKEITKNTAKNVSTCNWLVVLKQVLRKRIRAWGSVPWYYIRKIIGKNHDKNYSDISTSYDASETIDSYIDTLSCEIGSQ